MKAIQYSEHGPADVMQYLDPPDPAAGPGQILVKLAAASVAPFDWKLRAGHLKNHFTLPMPSIPGRDGAGEVIAVGDGALDDNGNRKPVDVKDGDTVLYSKYGGTEIKIDGEDLLVLRESDVLAKVEK